MLDILDELTVFLYLKSKKKAASLVEPQPEKIFDEIKNHNDYLPMVLEKDSDVSFIF